MKTPSPKVGDEWEFQLPGKRKRRKIIESLRKRHGEGPLIAWWARMPKGRYTGLNVEALLKYGKRLTTKAQRDEWDSRKCWLDGRLYYSFDIGRLQTCSHPSCSEQTPTLYLTHKEFHALPLPKSGPVVARHILENQLGSAFCKACAYELKYG